MASTSGQCVPRLTVLASETDVDSDVDSDTGGISSGEEFELDRILRGESDEDYEEASVVIDNYVNIMSPRYMCSKIVTKYI